MGSSGVGKSNLYLRYTQNSFVEEYDPVIEDAYRKCFEMDNYQYLLDITEVPGQQEFIETRDQEIKNSNGFVVVYSTIDQASFVEISNIHSAIVRVRSEKGWDDPPVVLAGNKVDLVEQRLISKESGEQLASELGCVFLETSAKMSINVIELFETCAKSIIQKRNAAIPTNKRGRGGGSSLI
uniref:Uncharacterized protein n=1 Tax=Arcella intermedia TaxID=1963864 RepID=A0A6B2LLC9_9EUKA